MLEGKACGIIIWTLRDTTADAIISLMQARMTLVGKGPSIRLEIKADVLPCRNTDIAALSIQDAQHCELSRHREGRVSAGQQELGFKVGRLYSKPLIGGCVILSSAGTCVGSKRRRKFSS